MGTNEDDKEKYDLYTEQVVLHPAKKYKWLIRIGKLLLFAVSVVIAATLFMVFLYPVFGATIKLMIDLTLGSVYMMSMLGNMGGV